MTPDSSTRLVEKVADALAVAFDERPVYYPSEHTDFYSEDVDRLAAIAIAACRAELGAEVRGEVLRECLEIAQAKIQVRYADNYERFYDIPLNADQIEAEIRALMDKQQRQVEYYQEQLRKMMGESA